MSTLDRKLLRDVWRLKSQVLAIASVIACGFAIVVMTFGAMESLRTTRDAYYEEYRFAQIFSHLRRAPLLVAAEVGRIPGIAAWDVRITHYASLDLPGRSEPAAAQLISIPDTGQPRLNRLVLREGRLPLRGRNELVMSENMASSLGYVPGQKLGVILGGKKQPFTLVGIALSPEFVYVLAPGQLMPDDKAFGVIWMNRSILEASYELMGAFNDLSVLLAQGASEQDVISRLDRALARYGGDAAYGRADQTSHAFIDQELAQLNTIALVIPPIFLAVAAFLIHMVLSRLIDMERPYIGLFKSFGYTGWEVGSHYLKISLLVALVGVLGGAGVGLALGQWMTTMYQRYFHFPFLHYRVDYAVFALAAIGSFAAAITGAQRSVSRAVKSSPASAMAPPTPPSYHATAFDRMGVIRRATMPTQMIFRHVVRWPWRAGLTTLGVAMAVMLLVCLFFFFDAVDALAEGFFFQSNRQDIVVSLSEQGGDRASYEMAHLIGMRRVESILTVPVRVSHDQLNQRIGLQGIERQTQLHVFRDQRGNVFTLPRHGIVLSDQLARLVQAHIGDRVYVTFLDVSRRTMPLTVAGVTSEHVGVSAYMDRKELASLVGAPGSATSFEGLVDRNALPSLLRQLKVIPVVAAVSTREQSITSLREVMAKSMTIVIDFYIGLGAVIALGVVYNAARVALSERSHELATLRVLGFTRGEVSYVLLGEVALLVIAALPLGCVMGTGLAWGMSQAMQTKLFRVPFVVSPATFGVGVSVVLLSTIASLLIVAWRIGRLDLIAVLKTRE